MGYRTIYIGLGTGKSGDVDGTGQAGSAEEGGGRPRGKRDGGEGEDRL